MQLKFYIQALRLPFSVPTLFTYVLIWLALGLPFNFMFYFSTLSLLVAHLSSNLWNDYFDQKADLNNNKPTAFSGGSRMIQDNIISAKKFFYYALGFSMYSMLSAIILLFISAQPFKLLSVLVLVAFLSFFYTAPPFRFVYRGLGEIIIFLTFGPFIFWGVLYLTDAPFNNSALFISCIMGILTSRILFINEIPDYEADKKSLKNNWVVLLGVQNSKRVAILFSIVSAVFSYWLFNFKFFIGYCVVLLVLELLSYPAKKHEQRSVLGLLEVFFSGSLILLYMLLS